MTAKEKLYNLLKEKTGADPKNIDWTLALIARNVRDSETDRALHGFTKKQSFEMLTEGIGATISDGDPEVIDALQAAVTEYLHEGGDVFEELESAFNLPTSPITDAVMEILGAGSDIDRMPDRKRRVSHSAGYEILEDDQNNRRFTKTTAKESLVFEIDDINNLTGSNAPAKNLFIFSLIEANRQAISGGYLARDYINFPLQALVDNGSYTDLRAARRGFMQGLKGLTCIRVSGYVLRGKEEKRLLKEARIEVLFTGGNIKNNVCTVYLNPRIAWEIITAYFSILPKYYFRLSNRAKDLLYYIFYLARQNADAIKANGYFTISFRAIHSRLNLPFEGETSHPQRDIVEAIETALEEIEEENKTVYKNRQFNLLPIYPKPKKGRKRVTAAEFVNEGKLKVSFSGELAKQFEILSTRKTKKITDAQKKAARIEEKAAAIKKQKAQEKAP